MGGTLSLKHGPSTPVLPAFRVLRSVPELPDYGMPGRHDAAFLFTGNRTSSELGAAVHVHRAFRPYEYVVGSYESSPQPNPVPTAAGTQVNAEDAWMRQSTWVALDTGTGPIPVGSQTGNTSGSDMRDVARLVLPPSGELPRTTSTLSVGGTIRGGAVPPAVVDEVVFGDADVGDSFGEPGLQGGQFLLSSDLGVGELACIVEPQWLRIARGIHVDTVYFLQALPTDAGLLRIGSEIVCYDFVDANTGAIRIAGGGRALLGTTEEHHETGSAVSFLEGWTVSTLSGPTVRKPTMPCLPRLGAVLPPGMAVLTNSSGTRSMKSCCRFKNDSQRGCCSSMIETTTRSSIGRRRPLKRASSAWPSASPGAGSASSS